MRVLVASMAFAITTFATVSTPLSPFPLVGTVWAWRATGGDGTRGGGASPDRYTIELLPDGAARVRADCNRGGGTYTANDVDLRFGPIATTKRGCAQGSRDREFLEALAKVEGYRFEGADLVLHAASKRAELRFTPLLQ